MKTRSILLACFFLFMVPLISFGQSRPAGPEIVPGQILVQLNPSATINDVVHTNQLFKQQITGLKAMRHISPPMRIWLLEYDEGSFDHQSFISHLRNNRFVRLAQSNHVIENRATLPNDTEINTQWQYVNTGQSGGTAGADLDADLAWDITTGGVTPLGDTIVSCVIDDGIDFNHSDFGSNLWVNHAEIPNNNIDDDNNGYVDDYRGWDADQSNDNVSGGGHGTPVAGIVGAKGNNGNGVSGVNWDVKLMIVQGGGNEAQAIAAYTYPLVMRKRYNQTNGSEGAFVVSTNASWGINQGQPSAAPLWCAMYDTLGKYGVLNCGATANANWDIDVVGDLPTGCASDYLISVTNMTHNDVKETQAGYGLVTVDIGAFGSNTYTPQQGGGYGGFGGTSGATPHVCGTIALMYSAPCPTFITYAKTFPDSAALLIKQYIFDGGDPNASLANITSTGKRLNMRGALDQMLNDCDTSSCAAPFGLSTSNVVDTAASMGWLALGSATDFNLRYREVGSTNWTVIPNATTPYSTSNLSACTNYEFQVSAECGGNDTSGYSPSWTFQTDGCCEAPAGFSVDNAANTTADLSWNAVLAANDYNVRYRPTGTPTWTTVNGITTLSTQLTGLAECTEYEVQVSTTCDTGSTGYTASDYFNTLGCGACQDLSYCASNSVDASEEWIDEVTIGTYTNNSGSDNGYGDYTGAPIDVNQGQTVNFTLTPGYGGQAWDEYFEIFIDYNHDGDFDDADEQAYDASGLNNAAVSGSFTVPATATPGITRLRVVMRYNQSAGNCTVDFDFGEVEDYCLNVMTDSSGSSIGELNGAFVQLYPNPSDQYVTVKVLGVDESTLVIFDATGREVARERLTSSIQTISTGEFENGVYLYRVITDNKTLQDGKLIIQR